MAGRPGDADLFAVALAQLLRRRDVRGEALEAALAAASQLCCTASGAEAFVAAGGLQSAAALLRSTSPGVSTMAVMALMAAARSSGAVERALAADTAAVEALTALMERLPGGDLVTALRPLTVATLLSRLCGAARQEQSGPSRCTPVTAAIVRAGGVPLAVGVLRGLLEGGGGPAPPLPPAESATVVCGIIVFCAGDAAALRAARDAGALPLVARALVEAKKDPGPNRVICLEPIVACLHQLITVSPADDVAALASQPAFAGALAAALGLAARAGRGGAAAGGCSIVQAQGLAQTTLAFFLDLLDSAPSNHAAALSFARAGGTSHLVRAPAAMRLLLLAVCTAAQASLRARPAGGIPSASRSVCACVRVRACL
jgi:hypothetical protein